MRAALLLLLVGCASEAPEPTATCGSCHGGEAGPAPPNALGGSSDPSLRGVGAHTAHLGSTISSPVPCGECHVVPATVDAPGHIDDAWPADLTWGPLAAGTMWEGSTLTCSNSACHGAAMAAPGPGSEPIWTSGVPQTCGSCHQFPPPAPHPAGGSCGECHAPTATGNSLADVTTHIDGILQLDGGPPGGNCAASCHGDDDQPAPPTDLAGNTDTTFPGVGAHEAHLNASLGVSVSCATCHPIPNGANDIGAHIDGTNDLIFEGIANNGGVTASFDPVAKTCSTYCHQAGSPDWTVVDGSALGCASCHGNPPPPPHPASASCENCHATGGAADPANHIDGELDF